MEFIVVPTKGDSKSRMRDQGAMSAKNDEILVFDAPLTYRLR